MEKENTVQGDGCSGKGSESIDKYSVYRNALRCESPNKEGMRLQRSKLQQNCCLTCKWQHVC